MPNWCEGCLKVRGTFANLKDFVKNGMEAVGAYGSVKSHPLIEETADLFYMDGSNTLFYLENTRRHFVEPYCIEFYTKGTGDEPIVILLPLKAAWGIDACDLQKLCQKYHVDMKIQGFERGMQFSQLIEIIDGKIVEDKEIKYDDWYWDCPCPDVGG